MADPQTNLPPLPPGFVLDQQQDALPPLPAGFTLDSQQDPEESPGFLDRVQADLLQRGENVAGPGGIAERSFAGEQGAPESFLQLAGQGAGAVLDVTGEAVTSLGGTALEAFKTVAPEAHAAIAEDLNRLVGSDVGQLAISAIEGGVEAYRQFSENNPRAAANINASVNVASLLVPVKGKPKVPPVRSTNPKQTARALGVSKGSLKRIQRGFDDSVNTGTLSSATRGDDLLLDLSPGLRVQAMAIAQTPGAAGQRILDAVHSRAAGAGGRIQDALDTGIGTDLGRTIVKQTATAEKKAAGAMFGAAKKSGAVFEMSPLRNAINQNADLLVVQGGDKMRTFLEKLPEGAVDAKTMHFVRQNLDDMINQSIRDGSNNLTNSLRDVRRIADRDLKSIPGWEKADNAFRLAKQKEEAFDAGRGVFQRNAPSPDELQSQLKGMDPEVRSVFVQGARDAISKMMGHATNDGGAAIRELSQKAWNRQNLELMIGPKSKGLLDALEREQRQSNTRQVISGNSATAMRLAAQEEFPSAIGDARGAEGLLSSLSTPVKTAVASLANKIFNGGLTARAGKFADETSRLLTSTGLEREAIVRELKQLRLAQGRKPTKSEITGVIARKLAVPAVVGTTSVNADRKQDFSSSQTTSQ